MKILYVNCCIREDDSRTKKLVDAFLNNLNPNYQVDTLNLVEEDLKPLTGKFFLEREKLLSQSDLSHERFRYAHQFQKADTIVIAAPFWDLSFPSLLKIYIENICVDGITFHSSVLGLQGDCVASNLIYFTTRGGFYDGDPLEQATPYLKAMTKFFGIGNFECISADGMDVQGYDSEASLNQAIELAVNLAKKL